MKKRIFSTSTLLFYLMIFVMLIVGCGGGGGGGGVVPHKSVSGYTVTFDSQEATTAANPTSIRVIAPATTVGALPAEPAKDTFHFAGWWTQPNGGGTEFLAGTTVTANLTVYAYWSTDAVLTITYDSQGGTAIGTQHAVSGSTVVLPPAPTKAGFNFDGWYTAVNGGGTKLDQTTPVTSNWYVYANWTANTVDYFTAGGTYTYASNKLTMKWTGSDFGYKGPDVRIEAENPLTINATTMTWTDMIWSGPLGTAVAPAAMTWDTITWRRSTGTAGDPSGTWTATLRGITYTLVFVPDSPGATSGTVTVAALQSSITSCGKDDLNPGMQTQYWPQHAGSEYRANFWYHKSSGATTPVTTVTPPGTVISESDTAVYWATSRDFGNADPGPFTINITDAENGPWSKVFSSCFMKEVPSTDPKAFTVNTSTRTVSWPAVSATDARYKVKLTGPIPGTSLNYESAWLTEPSFYINDDLLTKLKLNSTYHAVLITESVSTCLDGYSFVEADIEYKL